MKVCIATSVSENIRDIAHLTMPNKLEYCLRHGYQLHVNVDEYSKAVLKTAGVVWWLLERHDLVWTLDADAVITNMKIPIDSLSCIGPGVTVCEENIVDWNKINCGSVLWRKGLETDTLLVDMSATRDEWVKEPCQAQTWMGRRSDITVVPTRTFNSVEWTHPAGVPGQPGSHWQPGDLVYHPCGVFPMHHRADRIRSKLADGVTR